MRLQATLRMRQTSASILGWWLGELAALIPEAWRQRLSAAEGRLVLAIDGDNVMVGHPDIGRGIRPLYGLDGAIPAEIEAVLRRARRGAVPVCLRLPQRCALSSRMRLPLAAEQNLREAIGFELDRQTPFKADEVLFSYRVTERAPAVQRLVVELTVVPRGIVDDALAVATRLGMAPSRAEVADGSGNLLPPQRTAARWRTARRLPAALAGLAVLLAVAAVVVPLQRSHAAADALRGEVEAVRKNANAGLRLQGDIARLGEENRFLADRKQAQPSVSEVLAELTRLLPDDAFLTDLHIAGAELQASGSAASATALLERLDQSPFFTGAAFRSPVLRDAKLGRESFQIALRIARDKAK